MQRIEEQFWHVARIELGLTTSEVLDALNIGAGESYTGTIEEALKILRELANSKQVAYIDAIVKKDAEENKR